MTSKENFIRSVRKNLDPLFQELDDDQWSKERAESICKLDSEFFYEKKASIQDAVAYLRCVEDINPKMDEDKAIAKMDEIMKKYNGPTD